MPPETTKCLEISLAEVDANRAWISECGGAGWWEAGGGTWELGGLLEWEWGRENGRGIGSVPCGVGV